jgi:Arc/MetJ family transcription regulator
MAKEKVTITLDRRVAEEAQALTGARSTSEAIDIALKRLVRAERLRRDILAYQQTPPTDDERALAGLADFAALAEDGTDWAKVYGLDEQA